jgi:hypothetical protein
VGGTPGGRTSSGVGEAVGERDVVGVTAALVAGLVRVAIGADEDAAVDTAREHAVAASSTNVATTVLGIRQC